MRSSKTTAAALTLLLLSLCCCCLIDAAAAAAKDERSGRVPQQGTRAKPNAGGPKSCFATVVREGLPAGRNVTVGMSAAGNLFVTAEAGGRAASVTWSAAGGGCGFQPPSMVDPAFSTFVQAGFDCDSWGISSVAAASKGGAQAWAATYAKSGVRLQDTGGAELNATTFIGTAYRWTRYPASPMKGRWTAANDLAMTFTYKFDAGLVNCDNYTTALNIQPFVHMSDNGNVVMVNWVAQACWSPDGNASATFCDTAAGNGGLSIFEYNSKTSQYAETFRAPVVLDLTYNVSRVSNATTDGDARYASLSGDGKVAASYGLLGRGGVATIIEKKGAAWRWRAAVYVAMELPDIFNVRIPNDPEPALIAGVFLSGDGATLAAVGTGPSRVPLIGARPLVGFWRWQPASARTNTPLYKKLCTYEEYGWGDLMTMSGLDEPSRTGYGVTSAGRQRVAALLRTTLLGNGAGSALETRIVYDFPSAAAALSKPQCGGALLVMQETAQLAPAAEYYDKIFVTSNGLNALATNEGAGMMTMTTLPLTGFAPNAPPV